MFERGFKTWCETIASVQRKELGVGAIDPLDPFALAEHLGVRVMRADEIPDVEPSCLKTLTRDDPDSWSAITLSMDSDDLIILNPTHSGGRPASDLMHELAHIIAGHAPSRVDVSEDGMLLLNSYDRSQEEQASWLAGCLLLPREALVAIRRSGLSVEVVSKRYGVSPAMLRYRLDVTGVNRQLRRGRPDR